MCSFESSLLVFNFGSLALKNMYTILFKRYANASNKNRISFYAANGRVPTNIHNFFLLHFSLFFLLFAASTFCVRKISGQYVMQHYVWVLLANSFHCLTIKKEAWFSFFLNFNYEIEQQRNRVLTATQIDKI